MQGSHGHVSVFPLIISCLSSWTSWRRTSSSPTCVWHSSPSSHTSLTLCSLLEPLYPFICSDFNGTSFQSQLSWDRDQLAVQICPSTVAWAASRCVATLTFLRGVAGSVSGKGCKHLPSVLPAQPGTQEQDRVELPTCHDVCRFRVSFYYYIILTRT